MLRQNGTLRVLKTLGYNHPAVKEYKRQQAETGRKIHQQNLDRNEQLTATRLEAALMGCKSTWYAIGYNQEEVALLEEAWALTTVKDKETYRADKKKARELQKQAQASRAARQ
jgi:hypothetical protein